MTGKLQRFVRRLLRSVRSFQADNFLDLSASVAFYSLLSLGPLAFLVGRTLRRLFDGGVAPERWGDYTGMTLDPNGRTFWYAGQYAAGEPALSIVTGNELANWGTYVGSFEFPGCN